MVAEPRASVLKIAASGKQSMQLDVLEKENEVGAALADQANLDAPEGQKKLQKTETPYSHMYDFNIHLYFSGCSLNGYNALPRCH